MKKACALLFCFLFAFGVTSFAQRHKKSRKHRGNQMPTTEQLMTFKDRYKKILSDSVNIAKEKRDTVAALQVSFLLKKMKISNDKELSKDDKEVRYGMLQQDKYMHLGALLSVPELERLRAFEARQQRMQKAQEEAREEQANQRSNQMRSNRRRYNNRGYGGYGGYGGYRGY